MNVEPSLLSADFGNLERDVKMLNKSKASQLHLDIMDGTLVPNISFGFPVVEAVAKCSTLPLDAHLMVVEPQRWFEKLNSLGVKRVSFHLEASGRNTGKYIDQLHSLGIEAGIAIDPDVPVKKLFKYIGKADFFLIMSVFAGFGGQKFIYESIDRISALKERIGSKGDKAWIQVDGGVSLDNVKALKDAGASNIVAGSSVFKSENPLDYIDSLSVN